jgi:hypothetical protein
VGFGNDRIVADSLAYEGEMASIVETVEPKNYANAFQRALSFHQLSLGAGHRNGDKGRAALVRAGTAFTKLLEKGEIRVHEARNQSAEKAAPAGQGAGTSLPSAKSASDGNNEAFLSADNTRFSPNPRGRRRNPDKEPQITQIC